MKAAFDATTEGRLRERIRRLEKTLAAYDHAINTRGIDAYRKRVALLESALTDVIIPRPYGDVAKILEESGLSAERAKEIFRLLTEKPRL